MTNIKDNPALAVSLLVLSLAVVMIGGVVISDKVFDTVLSMVSVESKVVNQTEYTVTDIDFKYDVSFLGGDQSKVTFETSDGLIVYPRSDVTYHKSETTHTTITVREYDTAIKPQVEVYISEDIRPDVQTKHVLTYDANIKWKN